MPPGPGLKVKEKENKTTNIYNLLDKKLYDSYWKAVESYFLTPFYSDVKEHLRNFSTPVSEHSSSSIQYGFSITTDSKITNAIKISDYFMKLFPFILYTRDAVDKFNTSAFNTTESIVYYDIVRKIAWFLNPFMHPELRAKLIDKRDTSTFINQFNKNELDPNVIKAFKFAENFLAENKLTTIVTATHDNRKKKPSNQGDELNWESQSTQDNLSLIRNIYNNLNTRMNKLKDMKHFPYLTLYLDRNNGNIEEQKERLKGELDGLIKILENYISGNLTKEGKDSINHCFEAIGVDPNDNITKEKILNTILDKLKTIRDDIDKDFSKAASLLIELKYNSQNARFNNTGNQSFDKTFAFFSYFLDRTARAVPIIPPDDAQILSVNLYFEPRKDNTNITSNIDFKNGIGYLNVSSVGDFKVEIELNSYSMFDPSFAEMYIQEAFKLANPGATISIENEVLENNKYTCDLSVKNISSFQISGSEKKVDAPTIYMPITIHPDHLSKIKENNRLAVVEGKVDVKKEIILKEKIREDTNKKTKTSRWIYSNFQIPEPMNSISYVEHERIFVSFSYMFSAPLANKTLNLSEAFVLSCLTGISPSIALKLDPKAIAGYITSEADKYKGLLNQLDPNAYDQIINFANTLEINNFSFSEAAINKLGTLGLPDFVKALVKFHYLKSVAINSTDKGKLEDAYTSLFDFFSKDIDKGSFIFALNIIESVTRSQINTGMGFYWQGLLGSPNETDKFLDNAKIFLSINAPWPFFGGTNRGDPNTFRFTFGTPTNNIPVAVFGQNYWSLGSKLNYNLDYTFFSNYIDSIATHIKSTLKVNVDLAAVVIFPTSPFKGIAKNSELNRLIRGDLNNSFNAQVRKFEQNIKNYTPSDLTSDTNLRNTFISDLGYINKKLKEEIREHVKDNKTLIGLINDFDNYIQNHVDVEEDASLLFNKGIGMLERLRDFFDTFYFEEGNGKEVPQTALFVGGYGDSGKHFGLMIPLDKPLIFGYAKAKVSAPISATTTLSDGHYLNLTLEPGADLYLNPFKFSDIFLNALSRRNIYDNIELSPYDVANLALNKFNIPKGLFLADPFFRAYGSYNFPISENIGLNPSAMFIYNFNSRQLLLNLNFTPEIYGYTPLSLNFNYNVVRPTKAANWKFVGGEANLDISQSWKAVTGSKLPLNMQIGTGFHFKHQVGTPGGVGFSQYGVKFNLLIPLSNPEIIPTEDEISIKAKKNEADHLKDILNETFQYDKVGKSQFENYLKVNYKIEGINSIKYYNVDLASEAFRKFRQNKEVEQIVDDYINEHPELNIQKIDSRSFQPKYILSSNEKVVLSLVEAFSEVVYNEAKKIYKTNLPDDLIKKIETAKKNNDVSKLLIIYQNVQSLLNLRDKAIDKLLSN